jgi:hypothetical protein
MSEATPETPATPAPEAQAQPADQNVDLLPEWAREAISKANKEAAGYRTKVRELEPLATRAQELEAAQQTEAERIAARATAAERERDEAKAEGLRYKAAATHGIGEDYFDLLGTGDAEAIGERAQKVGALLKVQSENAQLRAEVEALRAGKPAPIQGRPVEALKPGATPEHAPTEEDEVYARLFGPQTA